MSGGRKKIFAGAILLLALFAVVFALSWRLSKPPAPGAFGALAMSADSTAYGTAWGYHDAMSAYKRSIDECNRSGGHNCVVKVSLNNTCGSLVTSRVGRLSYVVTDNDQFQAAAFGLAQ